MGEGFDLAPSRGVLHGKSMYDVSVDIAIPAKKSINKYKSLI
jgi:hypothetical protein